MAEPGGAVEVHGDVAPKQGTVAKGDPDVLVAQIERTREDLARTIDNLAERVSPAYNVRLLQRKVAEQAARPEVRVAAAGAAVAIAGLVLLGIWARRRRDG